MRGRVSQVVVYAVTVVVGALAGCFAGSMMEPEFVASRILYVTASGAAAPANVFSSTQFVEQQLASLAVIGSSDGFGVATREALGVDPAAVYPDVDVEVPRETALLQVTATDTTSSAADAAADAAAASLVEMVGTRAAGDAGAPLSAVVAESSPAEPADRLPPWVQWGLIGTVAGLAVALALGRVTGGHDRRTRGVPAARAEVPVAR